MAIVLGIDAAWTATQASGVALLDAGRAAGRCVVATPSYFAFLALARGGVFRWDERQLGGEAPVEELLAASEALVGRSVDIIAVDMPLSTQVIAGRREADQAVSREFGGRKCSTHSPNASRPGPLGARLTKAFLSLGYPVATTETPPTASHRVLEVYPHPALLALLRREQRVPYKVANARKHWPDRSAEERSTLLRSELKGIEAALVRELGPLPFSVPGPEQPVPTRALKAYEDALDAVVSAWVGVLYLEGKAVALGDASGAVWCPASVIRG